MKPKSHFLKGLVWLGIAVLSWGAVFSVAKRTLPVLDPFFLGSARYAIGVLGFNNGVKYLGALNAMLMLNLIPIIVFAIEAWLGRSFAAIEIGGAAVVIGALVANNLYLRSQSFYRG